MINKLLPDKYTPCPGEESIAKKKRANDTDKKLSQLIF